MIYSLSLLFYSVLVTAEEHRVLQYFRAFIEKPATSICGIGAQDGARFDRDTRRPAERVHL
jgi:hypothetical protein